ncbi:MAG: hypothetical protein IJN62_05555 [Clostridia bacterium]|nr:hypothetical protein [Clostridia bacterium]
MKKIIASEIAVLDSNVHTGGGTDVTDKLQAALDEALSCDGVHLVVDGAALVKGLKLHSNTIIECINDDCGFFMADHTNRPILTNANWALKGKGNKNITIIGGTYNHNCTKQDHDVPASQYPNPEGEMTPEYAAIHRIYLMEFYGIENFKLSGVTFKNQRTYTFTMGNFKNVIIENSSIDMAEHVHPSNQDGYHFFGPGQFLTMRNLRGCTGDDFINLAPDEMDGKSPITDVLIDGIFFDEVCQGIRMLSEKDGLLDRITVRNVTGTYRMFGFSIIPFITGNTFGNVGDLYFENIDLRQIPETYHYTPMQFFGAGGNIKSLTLKNVRFHNPVRGSLVFDIGRPFFFAPDELTEDEIEEYNIDMSQYPVKDWMPDKQYRPTIGTFTIDGLTIDTDEVMNDKNYMEFRYNFDNLILKNIHVFRKGDIPASGILFKLANEAKIGNLIIEDVFAEKLGAVLSTDTGNEIGLLKVSNVTLKDGGKIFDTDDASVGATLTSDINEVTTNK